MDDESLEQVERQLADLPLSGAPATLRASVLAEMQRELRAASWDRRLTRTAVILLVLGVGMNVAIGLKSAARSGIQPHFVKSTRHQSIVEAAVVMAEATDAATGRQFARQLATMIGQELTENESAAIDAAIHRSVLHAVNGYRG